MLEIRPVLGKLGELARRARSFKLLRSRSRSDECAILIPSESRGEEDGIEGAPLGRPPLPRVGLAVAWAPPSPEGARAAFSRVLPPEVPLREPLTSSPDDEANV